MNGAESFQYFGPPPDEVVRIRRQAAEHARLRLLNDPDAKRNEPALMWDERQALADAVGEAMAQEMYAQGWQ